MTRWHDFTFHGDRARYSVEPYGEGREYEIAAEVEVIDYDGDDEVGRRWVTAEDRPDCDDILDAAREQYEADRESARIDAIYDSARDRSLFGSYAALHYGRKQ